MKLTCLGVNGPFPEPKGATSGYLVTHGDTRIVMDMGSGTLGALTHCTAPEAVTAVLLSHWHFDHSCDLLPWAYRIERQLAKGEPPLHVYGPVEETAAIRQVVQSARDYILHDVHPGDVLTIGDIQVQVGQARHPAPAVMYRLTADGRSLCYTGDTNQTDALVPFASGCNLLLADGPFLQAAWDVDKPHMSACLAAQQSLEAKAERLIITHLNPFFDAVSLLQEARAVRPDAILAQQFATYDV